LSATLVAKLAEDQEGTLGRVQPRQAAYQAKLARLLGPYGIISQKVTVGTIRGMGYLRVWFEDAWCRYLPPAETSDETGERPPQS
jgi:hypothetical protein